MADLSAAVHNRKGRSLGSLGSRCLLWAGAFLGDLLLFFTAYIPLLLMLAALQFEARPSVAFLLVTCAVIIGTIFAIALFVATRVSAVRTVVKSVSDDGHASMAYMATYILPFISGVPGSPGGWAALGVYAATLFLIFRATEVKAVNPTLYLFGYRISHIHDATNVGGKGVYVIHRKPILANTTVLINRFGGARVARIASS